MKGFDTKFIDELKSKNDIVDVISRYVHLEQRGTNFWGRCPFHHEKTASFCINATGQFYYCFGCHKSGDVIAFIRDIESLDFNDAVKFLAERVNMTLPEIRYEDEKYKVQKKHKERILSLLKDTARFYVSNLKKDQADKHVEYILSRKLSAETVATFGIGASLDFNSLPEHLEKLGYTREEMIDSGAVSIKNNRVFDALAGRLIIPTIDQFGSVIAFCGRIIDGRKDVGKYVNTKETIAFSKGKTFFNINNLKKLKNQSGLDGVIMVEGQMDVISLVQAGIKNVVASMGTAFTKDQARMIKMYSDKVYISYDGDGAGQKATLRGLEILSEEGIDVKIISLPDNMDPDDVIRTYGADGYRKLIVSAKPLIDFKLDLVKKTFDVNTIDGKRKYAQNAIKVIKESGSASEQEDLLKTVREITGFTFDALKRELYREEKTATLKVVELPTFNDSVGDKNQIASRFLLASFLFNKSYTKGVNIQSLEFELPVYNQIKEYIIDCQEKGKEPRFSNLYELLDGADEELSKIAGTETEEGVTYDKAEYFADCIRTLKLSSINTKIERLSSLFKEQTDSNERKRLSIELTELLQEKVKLSK